MVGAEEASFIVHEGPLCTGSRFFQAACTGGFKESHERIIRLPEIEPAHFESFLQWLYTQALHHVYDRDVDRHYEGLFHLYFLGEKLQVQFLKNAIIDATIKLEQSSAFVPCTDQVRLVFDQTGHENPLRRLLVDMHAWDVEPRFMADHQEWFAKDFLLELALVSMEFRETHPTRSPPYVMNPKSYHEVV